MRIRTGSNFQIQLFSMLNDKTLDPKDLMGLTGVSADLLRLWRNRGVLDRVGQKLNNGRWKYSLRDCVSIATANYLRSFIGDQEVAMRLAIDLSNDVLRQMGFWGVPEQELFVAVWDNSALPLSLRRFPADPLSPWASYHMPLRDEWQMLNLPAAIVIDVRILHYAFPQNLIGAINYASLNKGRSLA